MVLDRDLEFLNQKLKEYNVIDTWLATAIEGLIEDIEDGGIFEAFQVLEYVQILIKYYNFPSPSIDFDDYVDNQLGDDTFEFPKLLEYLKTEYNKYFNHIDMEGGVRVEDIEQIKQLRKEFNIIVKPCLSGGGIWCGDSHLNFKYNNKYYYFNLYKNKIEYAGDDGFGIEIIDSSDDEWIPWCSSRYNKN
jgi:hypothetical protein